MICDGFNCSPAPGSQGTTLGRIAILYPSDPAGHVPSGIDSFIRGMLKWAPNDLDYTLYGASSDITQRPLGVRSQIELGRRPIHFLPVTSVDPNGMRQRIPLTVRFIQGLRKAQRAGLLDAHDVLDVHRIEPLLILRNDPRPKNVYMHQDMSVLRDAGSDILWSKAPAIYEWAERTLLQGADRVFCVRETAVSRYRQRYPELAERFAFTPTWVDTDVFVPRPKILTHLAARASLKREKGISETGPLIITVGRLDKQKDPFLMLRSFASVRADVPDAQLAFIGDGALRRALEAEIAALQLQDSVTLLGALPGLEISKVLWAADLFALSSAYEGMPIAVLEALACGLPIVSTNVGEVTRVVRTGFNGAVVSERSPRAMSRAMLETLRQSGRSVIEQNCFSSVIPFTAEAVLGDLYQNHRRQAARGIS
jgi:glycosyltransferase involved in cell wall biosynthesis